jgi:hypothetical protein
MSRNRASHAATASRSRRRIRAAVEALEVRLVLSSFVVNTVADQIDPAGSKTVSLRDAVAQADALTSGSATISFDPTVFATAKTISLDTYDNGGVELSDTRASISIVGPAAGVTIDGNLTGATILTVDAGVAASLSGLTIAMGPNGSIDAGGYAAVVNSGNLTFSNGTVSSDGAGGFSNSGTLVVQNSTISGNNREYGGGVDNTGTVTLINSTISDDSGLYGGGLYNKGAATVTGCTFSGDGTSSGPEDFPDDGGAIDNFGTLKVTDSTLSGNASDIGGAIYNSDAAVVSDCTITANNFGIYEASSATFSLGNSVVAGNMGVDVYGAIKSQGHNLIGQVDANNSGWVASDQTGTDAHPLNPDLAPLGFYGGPTQTQFPLTGSPAIGAGSVALIPAGVGTDQRGFARVVGGKVDIGAVQLGHTSVVTVTPPAAQSAVAGVASTFKLGSFTDPGGKGPFIVNVVWGDGAPGSVYTAGAAGPLASQSHAFINTGSLKGTIVVIDASGDISQPATFTVSSAPAPSQTITVDTTADQTDPSGSKTVSLLDAVSEADAGFGPVTIAFDPKVFAAPQTITLASPLEFSANRFGTITIAGPAAGVTVAGEPIVIDSLITAGISRLTITGVNYYLGAIENAGTTTLVDSTVSGNIDTSLGGRGSPPVSGTGGGIDNTGVMTVLDSTIASNSAVSGRYGYGEGGGIFNSGVLTVTDSTVSGNNAQYGGGINNVGTMTLTNSTISANTGAGGGGIENRMGAVSAGTATITDCTLSGNTGGVSDRGGPGSGGIDNSDGGAITLANTIVAGNNDSASAAPDVAGTFKSLGHNLIGTTAGGLGWISSDLTGSSAHPLNPVLAPLSNNGGPTQTQLPLAGSPAIGAGSIALIPPGVTTDQRGMARVVNGKVDIGAVELQAGGAAITGTVFNDANGDGTQENGEAGLAGVQVYADLGNVGYFVSGDPSTTTNATGGYALSGLTAGNYVIRQVRPLGDAQTTPVNNLGHHVTVAAGQTVAGQNFGDKSAATPPATISGTVFNDANGDGTQDNGETGLAGVEVYLDLGNLGYFVTGDPFTTTLSTGGYTLSGLAAGNYIVRQALPLGYVQTVPGSGFGRHVAVSAGQTLSGENFGDKA